MSLTSYVKLPEVRERLKPFRIKPPRSIGASLKVEPKTKNYGIIGRAFDYLLRFELQRRAPHAKARSLVAEKAPNILSAKLPGSDIYAYDQFWDRLGSPDYLPPQEVSKRATLIVANAKSAIARYLKNRNPSPATLAKMAAHAIRLAYLASTATKPQVVGSWCRTNWARIRRTGTSRHRAPARRTTDRL
jgi:hypothetical protein